MKKNVFVIAILCLFCISTITYAQTSVTANPSATATAAPVTNIYTNGDPSLSAAAGNPDPVAYRGYNIVGNIPGVPLISHFGPRSNSGAFKTTPELLTYAWLFTESALEGMAGGEAEFSQTNNYKNFPKAGKMKDGERWIAIVLQKRVITKNAKNEDVAGEPIPYTFKDSDGLMKRAAFRGYANSYAKDEETKMQNTLAAGALAALKAGCNVYEVTDEGAAIDTQSRGWTVGLYSSIGYMPSGNNQTTSTVSGVGAAYGRSVAGMRDKPWINGNGLVVPDFVMAEWLSKTAIDDWAKPAPEPKPAPAAAPPEPPKQTGNHVPKS